MLKQILQTISICTIVLLLLIGTTQKPFKLMITMAQQLSDSYPKGNLGLEDKNTEKNIDKDKEQQSSSPDHNNKPPLETKDPITEVSKSPLAFENTTLIDKNGKQMITNGDSLLVLVNKKRNLAADYIPKELVIPKVRFSFEGDSPKKYLKKEAALALEELFQAAAQENLTLLAASGYRSYETQKNIFENKARSLGEKTANMTSAYPGQSEHQTGLAMDITCAQVNFGLSESFGEVKEGIWVKENAYKYGFIIRYPKGKEEITGYNYEPWHLRFVGKETAAAIHAEDITLEEYFAQVYQYKF